MQGRCLFIQSRSYLQSWRRSPSLAVEAVNCSLCHLPRLQESIIHVALPPRPLCWLARTHTATVAVMFGNV